MLRVSDAAASILRRNIERAHHVDTPRIRLGVVGDDVKMAIDRERPGDTTVGHRGQSLIVMDTVTSQRLARRRLDVDDVTRRLFLVEDVQRAEDKKSP